MREPTEELRHPPRAAVHASRAAALLEALWERPVARAVAFSAAAGLFLSFVGAFGTGAVLSFGPRTLMFVGFSVPAGLLGFYGSHWAGGRAWARGHVWRRFAAVVALMTPLMGLAIWAVVVALSRPTAPFALLPTYFAVSLAMSAAMTALALIVLRPTPVTRAGLDGAAPPRFLERLPATLRGGEVWAVRAEDHYLRVYTSRGEELILMRLVDAVGELDGIEGAQTHRSWWVARGAIEEVKRGDGRATLVLKGGTEVPVSRTYARALRAAGWF